MSEGWIKIHRQILDNRTVCRDADHLAIWMYILCNAAYADHDTWFAGDRFSLKPGQFITGRKKIAEFLGVNESKVERVLKKFENEHQIEQQTTANGRLITVINWDRYQESEQQTEQQVNNKRTTSEQPVNTTKERKKERKEEYSSTYDSVVAVWNDLPEPISKITRITKGSSREKKLHKRILDYGEDTVLTAIQNIKKSSFLQGGGSKGWVVTFDWFVSPENFVKVLEGNYSDQAKQKTGNKFTDITKHEYDFGALEKEILGEA